MNEGNIQYDDHCRCCHKWVHNHRIFPNWLCFLVGEAGKNMKN
jgi:hypothetical protein